VRPAASAVLLLLLSAAAARAGESDALEVRTDTLHVVFALPGGDPTSWQGCYPSCADARTSETFVARPGEPLLRLVARGDAELSQRLAALAYRAERRDDAKALVLELASEPLAEGVALHKQWRWPRRGYEAELVVSLEGENAEAFARAHKLDLALAADGDLDAASAGVWHGVRGRFWALVASNRPGAAPEIGFGYRVYSGPIERSLLRAADPPLKALLFAHLWFWMRWLALGLTLLLSALRSVVGNAGIAIILLAPCVKVLMRPLSALAERWQRDVNETRTRLQPEIEAIRASARGAERSRRLLELHREHGVTPFYGLRSLLSVAIQVPVFFAAYHALDECFALAGVPFLWIADLTQPDAFATLPHALPYFGGTLNLLPFVMTATTLLSSRQHDDGTLTPELLRRQRLGLYALALAFFLLFYPFPAGMVLYWTSNNLVALAWGAVARRLPRQSGRTGRLASGTIRR